MALALISDVPPTSHDQSSPGAAEDDMHIIRASRDDLVLTQNRRVCIPFALFSALANLALSS